MLTGVKKYTFFFFFHTDCFKICKESCQHYMKSPNVPVTARPGGTPPPCLGAQSPSKINLTIRGSEDWSHDFIRDYLGSRSCFQPHRCVSWGVNASVFCSHSRGTDVTAALLSPSPPRDVGVPVGRGVSLCPRVGTGELSTSSDAQG